jgi:hypothetical protein
MHKHDYPNGCAWVVQAQMSPLPVTGWHKNTLIALQYPRRLQQGVPNAAFPGDTTTHLIYIHDTNDIGQNAFIPYSVKHNVYIGFAVYNSTGVTWMPQGTSVKDALALFGYKLVGGPDDTDPVGQRMATWLENRRKTTVDTAVA